MTELRAEHFADFFRQLHGDRDPFPWQTDLARHVLESAAWPDVIDVPTGLGKTSILDIAVFALAAGNAAARRRVFFVVDRRLVVDEAYSNAKRIQAAIETADDGVLARVRARLISLQAPTSESLLPLRVTRMRGGTTWDAQWVDRPDAAAIVVGTVDQVGSRMLFRGYVTSDYRKPMDAALVGADSLILVDEAHLAGPMLETAARVESIDPHRVPIAPATVVRLSATAGTSGSRAAFDVDSHLAMPVARERLLAHKDLYLAQSDRKRLPVALADISVELMGQRPGARVLIVCNTVASARRTHGAVTETLRRSRLALHGPSGESVVPELLIGRCRSFERDARTDAVLDRFGVDRPRSDEHLDVLVATQTVEVGANLDVDVLVTESAPLSALIQRLGRLNRLGRSAVDAPVAVVVDDGTDDALYGDARRLTWEYLVSRIGPPRSLPQPADSIWSHVGAGPLAVRDLMDGAPPAAFAGEPPATPMLYRPTLSAWARTSPRPEPDVPVAPYLHGLRSGPQAVTMFWRDDVDATEPGRSDARLRAMPHTSLEGVEVPLASAVAWMCSTNDEPPVADVDTAVPDPVAPDHRSPHREVMVQTPDGWSARSVARVRPGDVIAVPSEWGGLDAFGWDPASRVPVADIRDVVSVAQPRKRPVLRVDSDTHRRILGAAASGAHDLRAAIATLFAPRDEEQGTDDIKTLLVDALTAAATDPACRPGYGTLLTTLTNDGPAAVDLVAVPEGDQYLLRGRTADRLDEASDTGTLDSCASKLPVPLDEHHAAVGARARAFCTAIGLPDDLSELVEFAARHHDLGKLDVRFQAALTDGNVFLAEILTQRALAKSGVHPASRTARRARKTSGLPRRFRHETWSAEMAAQLSQRAGHDSVATELVKHLVASHHGRARPLLPAVVDDAPRTLQWEGVEVKTDSHASVDFDGPSRFERLNDTFGFRGLAMLETVLRCADQTCSAEGM